MRRFTCFISLLAFTACFDVEPGEVDTCDELLAEARDADYQRLPSVADDLIAEECEYDMLLVDFAHEYDYVAATPSDAQHLAAAIAVLEGALLESDTDSITVNDPRSAARCPSPPVWLGCHQGCSGQPDEDGYQSCMESCC